MQWGTDDGVKALNQVVQGDASDDIIFREAEKLGLEVRSSNSGPTTDIAASKSLLFNFFDHDDVPVAEPNSTSIMSSNPAADVSFLTFGDILTLSTSFQREMCERELDGLWREGRDRLVRDYKKKRRELRKKVGARKRRRVI